MKFLIVSFLGLQIFFANAKVIPDDLPQPCPISASNYSECMKHFFTKLFTKRVTTGIRELHVPPLKPLFWPVLSVNTTINDVASVDSTFTNLRGYGYEDLQIKQFKFNAEALTAEIELFLPYIRVTLEYAGAIKALSQTSMVGSGYSKAAITNITTYFKFKMKPIQKLGVKYLAIDKYDTKFSIGSLHLKLIAKTREEQAIADLVQNIFNRDSQLIINTFAPVFNEVFGEVLKIILGAVIGSIPAQELFPGIDL